MEKINIVDFYQTLSETIEKVVENSETFVIQTDKGNAVIVPEASFNSILETIYLDSQPLLLEKIKCGEKESVDSLISYNIDEEW